MDVDARDGRRDPWQEGRVGTKKPVRYGRDSFFFPASLSLFSFGSCRGDQVLVNFEGRDELETEARGRLAEVAQGMEAKIGEGVWRHWRHWRGRKGGN